MLELNLKHKSYALKIPTCSMFFKTKINVESQTNKTFFVVRLRRNIYEICLTCYAKTKHKSTPEKSIAINAS